MARLGGAAAFCRDAAADAALLSNSSVELERVSLSCSLMLMLSHVVVV